MNADNHFMRRIANHLGTGKDSTSDPAAQVKNEWAVEEM
jgi:hypothetical protein